jgi:dTDP-4-dehydrorhamnose reductase
MAGHLIYNLVKNKFNNNYIVLGLSRNSIVGFTDYKLDVLNIEQLEKIFRDFKPDFVINCIGALINESLFSKSQTVLLNSYLPLKLSELGDIYGFNLIHLSTDCVFSGNKGDYIETDFHDSDDLYGKSKSIGESVNINNSCVIRTSIIGPEIRNKREGLFDWLFKQHGNIKGFKSGFWSGITTLELTYTVIKVIENNLLGIYNVTNGDKISKFELLNLIKNTFDLNQIEIQEDYDFRKDKSLKCSEKYDFIIKSYENQIAELKAYINEFSKIYGDYI